MKWAYFERIYEGGMEFFMYDGRWMMKDVSLYSTMIIIIINYAPLAPPAGKSGSCLFIFSSIGLIVTVRKEYQPVQEFSFFLNFPIKSNILNMEFPKSIKICTTHINSVFKAHIKTKLEMSDSDNLEKHNISRIINTISRNTNIWKASFNSFRVLLNLKSYSNSNLDIFPDI